MATPERATATRIEDIVDLGSNLEAIVLVVGLIIDALGEPIPEAQGTRLASQMCSYTLWIAKGEIESHQQAPTRVEFLPNQAGEALQGAVAGTRVLGFAYCNV